MALGDENGEIEISLPSVGGETDFALATLRHLDMRDYEEDRHRNGQDGQL